MNKHQKTAPVLIYLGCVILLLGSALHLLAGYPRVTQMLLNSSLDPALRVVFLLLGFTWITVVVVTLIATFVRTSSSKAIILFCGFSLLLQIPIWVNLMGWFITTRHCRAGMEGKPATLT